MAEESKWRWGVNRWFVLLFIVLGYFGWQAYPPILPHIQLPAEVLSESPLITLPVIGDFYITNTIVAVLIADVILIVMALMVRRAISDDTFLLSGLPGVIEAALEAMYDLTETTAGKWAKQIFPWFAAITLLVLVVNWMELIPGVDSIGFLHHDDHGYPVETVSFFGAELEGVRTIVEKGAAEGAEHSEDLYGVVPWVRVASTDLNFTLGLAVVSVFMTQVFGVRALGISYFTKFFNVKTLFSKPMFGAIDFGVSLLELISEISKILSFSFRLFGNIFAGTVLLFVIGTLVPVFAQTFFLLLEFFVGLIQALVFGLLTMIFMAQATVGHGPGEEGHH